jgi:hypothetical protein
MKQTADISRPCVFATALSLVIGVFSVSQGMQTGGDEAVDRGGLAGCYDVTGVDTFEMPYTGTLCIAVLGDLLYDLTWTQMEEDEGHVVYKGRGVSSGDDLFAVWSEDRTEYACYLHLFDIDVGDGSLNGLRVDVSGPTSAQNASRTGGGRSLDLGKAGQLAGSYVLDGSDEYTGEKLNVTRLPINDDDAYTFRWSGETDLEGVGVRRGDSVIVVANPIGQVSGTCGSITYSKKDGGRTLVGSFYSPDSLKGTTPTRRGEETATPKN